MSEHFAFPLIIVGGLEKTIFYEDIGVTKCSEYFSKASLNKSTFEQMTI